MRRLREDKWQQCHQGQWKAIKEHGQAALLPYPLDRSSWASWAEGRAERPAARVSSTSAGHPQLSHSDVLAVTLLVFPVYYFCVSRQQHFCQMVMGCQVRLLSGWCEETSADGRCHFLGLDVHTRHQQLMPLHWPCLPIGIGLKVPGRQGGRQFPELQIMAQRSLCCLPQWQQRLRQRSQRKAIYCPTGGHVLGWCFIYLTLV